MRTFILLMLALLSFPVLAVLPQDHVVKLDDPCYLNRPLLWEMFRKGVAPAECNPRVVNKFTEQVYAGVLIDASELRNHLIGILADRAKRAPDDTMQIEAVYNFFTMTRIPEVDKRAWATRIFGEQVYPRLSPNVRTQLSARLQNYWASYIGRQNRGQLELIITPVLLMMTPEQAAERISGLKAVADALGGETRSDLELRALQTIAYEYQPPPDDVRFMPKRNDPQVQAAIIPYLKSEQGDLRDAAVKALTHASKRREDMWKTRSRAAGLADTNVAAIAELLDNQPSYVITGALKVLAWQYASMYVEPEKAHLDLELNAKIAELLGSEDREIALAASSAFAVMHPSQSVSQLALVRALEHPNSGVRQNAITALDHRSTRFIRRVVDPVVFAAAVEIALKDGQEHALARSEAAKVIKSNLPIDLETIALLAEKFDEFPPSVKPSIRDVLRSAAARKTGLSMFHEDRTRESVLRDSLLRSLNDTSLRDEAELRSLLIKRNLTVDQMFLQLALPQASAAEEAAHLLLKSRPAEVRRLVHNSQGAAYKVEVIAGLLKTTNSNPLAVNLLTLVGQEELVPTVGRNASLLAAVINPAPAVFDSPAGDKAHADLMNALIQKTNTIQSGMKGDATVVRAIEAALARPEASNAQIITLLQMYDRLQTNSDAAVTFLFSQFRRMLQEETDRWECIKLGMRMVRARVPIPDAMGESGILGLIYEKETGESYEVRQQIVEILVASYASLLGPDGYHGEGDMFFPAFHKMPKDLEHFGTTSELLAGALRELRMALDESLVESGMEDASILHKCATEIGGKRKKKK